MRLSILHVRGARAGAREDFVGKSVLSAGRGSGNDVAFDDSGDKGVSFKHAKLEVVEQHLIVVDLESTNGTFVNGRRIRSAHIGPSDVVALGLDGPAFRAGVGSEGEPPMEFHPLPAAATVQVDPLSGDGQRAYGQRTLGLMIRQALATVGRSQKSTADIEALVERRVARSSARLRRIAVVVGAIVLIAAGVGGYALYRHRAVHVTQINYGSAAGGAIAAANRHTVFALAGTPKSAGTAPTGLQAFCSAFAVGGDLLATNAHCIATGSAGFSSVVALMNGANAAPYPVVEWIVHGDYREGNLSPDVGLIRVRGRFPSAVVRADDTALSQVGPGAVVFLYGFPGRLSDTAAPEATFVEGEIGRVTGFDLRVGEFRTNGLLQHSAYCTTGTSGSPIFDTSGRVIGINAGGYMENGQALSGYNFGMRIDLLDPLLAQFAPGTELRR